MTSPQRYCTLKFGIKTAPKGKRKYSFKQLNDFNENLLHAPLITEKGNPRALITDLFVNLPDWFN